MVNKAILDEQLEALSSMDPDVLDVVARDGDTTLLFGAFSKDIKLPSLPGGWAAGLSWDNARADSMKKIILLPNDDRTRGIWRVGQIKVGVDAGLTNVQAQGWVSSRAKQKHELLPKLVEVMKNPDWLKAYLSIPKAETLPKVDTRTKEILKDGEGNPIMENRISNDSWATWRKENGITFQMYDSKHFNLSQLVNDIVDYERNRNQPKQHKQQPHTPNPVMSKALLAAQAKIAELKKNAESSTPEVVDSTIPDEQLDHVANGNVGEHPSAQLDDALNDDVESEVVCDTDSSDLDDKLAQALADGESANASNDTVAAVAAQ